MIPLKPKAVIDIIAPAGKVVLPASLQAIEETLLTWGYQARFGQYLLGDHPFLSNTTELRFEDLKNALYATDSDFIWCYRGGSGCSELWPFLDTLSPPSKPKNLLGFSDITSLLLYFNQQWGWTTYHGSGAKQIVDDQLNDESINILQQFFQGKLSPLPSFQALNHAAKNISKLRGIITGGNLSVIIHTLGTPYQIQSNNKILFLEDTNEPAYKIRRMLTHLKQAQIFENITALLLGEFIQKNLEQKQWIEDELRIFGEQQTFPVFRTDVIGHGKTNYVIPLGSTYQLFASSQPFSSWHKISSIS